MKHSDLPTRVIVESEDISRERGMRREERLIKKYAEKLNLQVVVLTLKQLRRSAVGKRYKTTINRSDLVVGSIPFFLEAIRQLGIDKPIPTPYPRGFESVMHREIRHVDSLRKALLLATPDKPLFIKPASRHKSFNGFVCSDENDFYSQGTSMRQDVYVSDVVKFTAERRCYVANKEILLVEEEWPYPLNIEKTFKIMIDGEIKDLVAKADIPEGCAIDVGILDDGRIALVECNEGFSLGWYATSREIGIYFEVLWSYWKELMNEPKFTQLVNLTSK